MIGPHQGKELELMLAGKKHLAVFFDAIPEDGIISEEIIPELAFAPYVEKGQIIRISKECIYPGQINVRKVCFTTQGNEWRAHALLWLMEESIAGRRPFDDAHEFFVGRLLDYSEEDIQHFIQNLRERKNKAA